MTLSILNAPASNLPLLGAVPFSFTPTPSISDDLAALDQIGATCARIELPWSQGEPSQGVYSIPDYIVGRIEAARRSGRAIVILIDYSNPIYTGGVFNPTVGAQAVAAYSKFCAWVANKYRGNDIFIEVQNEPNNPGFWIGAPQPNEFGVLLKSATNAILAVNPKAQVISAGVGEVSQTNGATAFMRAVNASVGEADMSKLFAQTLHPYNASAGPESLFDYIDAYRAGVPYAGPIAVTEWGYPAQWVANNETTRAIYMARMIGCAILAQLKLMTIYNLRDRGTGGTIEETFGLFKYDFTPKPSALAVKRMMDALAGTVSYDAEKLPTGIYRIILRKADGSVVKLFWSTSATQLFHNEPMSSVSNITNSLGGTESLRGMINGMATVTVANAYPVMILTGRP